MTGLWSRRPQIGLLSDLLGQIEAYLVVGSFGYLLLNAGN